MRTLPRFAVLLACWAATTMAAGPPERVWRVMAVGDSITEGGSSFHNYRYPLLKRMRDAGYRMEYVGSRQSNSPAGVLRHEGYGGKNAEFLATVIGKRFHEHPADIVLIHAGHNHFIDEKPVPGIVAATETMIRDVRAVNPRVTVLLAQVITSGKLPKYSYIPELNAALKDLAGRLDTPLSPVVLVNQAERFDWTTDTVADKVHPNTHGAEKMAARWFAALTRTLGNPGWELSWSDEFDYPDAELEKTWVSQNGPCTHVPCSRWRENCVVTNGTLKLNARKEQRGGQEWTCGSIWTRKAFLYGYFECRYKYAGAEATNNSFWLMTTDKPPAGKKRFEIDINEGHYPNEVNSNIHNHSDVTVVNGKRTHPTSSRSYVFGVRPDVTIQLENPVRTSRLRFSSNHPGAVHIGELRAFGADSGGYPDPLSPEAGGNGRTLVDHVRDAATRITTSGFVDAAKDTSTCLADGRADTRWVSQRGGSKWVEVAFAEPRELGCIQFINGYRSKGEWKSLLSDYRVAYHDGRNWVEMAAFDVEKGAYNFAREFHTHGLEWNEDELVFYLDGKEIRREKNAFCHSPAPVWLSLAIVPWGGRITDAIDGTSMEVDYVRVYRGKP